MLRTEMYDPQPRRMLVFSTELWWSDSFPLFISIFLKIIILNIAKKKGNSRKVDVESYSQESFEIRFYSIKPSGDLQRVTIFWFFKPLFPHFTWLATNLYPQPTQLLNLYWSQKWNCICSVDTVSEKNIHSICFPYCVSFCHVNNGLEGVGSLWLTPVRLFDLKGFCIDQNK